MPDPGRTRRGAAYRKGHAAELIAAVFLAAKGYKLLARRYRTPSGEIDLVARRGRTIVFVEVKARPTVTQALEAVDRTAERRIGAAADLWLARHPRAANLSLRFDMVLIVPWRLPVHLRNAFA
ncbi:putative endonuclease [Faunimonas pinastri]|uniref:UPF0102 protein SAMN05216548_105185 n=1 Tax=Faunimonas pinastri TaxID=1855383 RepID=A0A1H9GY88_9HYPH|nr:YraN family protein [Faunimonas pinastri]SEQ54978.1 putative endonuclease [Faunimonas pinastri]